MTSDIVVHKGELRLRLDFECSDAMQKKSGKLLRHKVERKRYYKYINQLIERPLWA